MCLPAHQVTYYGHILLADGLRSDPVKIQVIHDMPPLTPRDYLETVLGMTTYLGKFAPNVSDITAPLRDLTKDNEFIWDAVKEKGCSRWGLRVSDFTNAHTVVT